MDRNRPENENMLEWTFVLSSKLAGTAFEKYEATFIVQGHKDKEKDIIINKSKTLRHKNIEILISVWLLYKFKVSNQDVDEA